MKTQEREKKLKISSSLSFAPFLQYLEHRIKQSDSNNSVLDKARDMIVAAFPTGDYTISPDKIEAYNSLYELVYQLMTSPLVDENQYSWGLTEAFSPQIVYGTNALRALISETPEKEMVSIVNFKHNCTLSEDEVKQVLIYSFLIKRLYNIRIFHSTNLIFRVGNGEDENYYQIDYDDRFIQVQFEGVLPQIDKTITEMESLSKESTLQWLQAELPLDKISFTGFSILKSTDVTEEILKNRLRDLLLISNLDQSTQEEISHIVRKLSGCNDLDILLLPILSLNNRIISEVWQTTFPQIEELVGKYRINPKEFYWALNKYASDPRLLFRENIQKNKGKNADLSVLANGGILEGLILKPIYSKSKLIGIILIASPCRNVISDLILVRLEDSIPLLQNLFESAVGHFRNMLDKTIKTKFTSIQPSVEWKFNEVALQYLKDKAIDKHPTLLPIRFENIYPIYGAVDFRNSTIERNRAERDDWRLQLEALVNTIQEIREILPIEILDELIFQAKEWMKLLNDNIDASTEFSISNFLEKKSLGMLQQLAQADKRITTIIAPYLNGLRPHGAFHKNSNALEKTFKILNANIASILDQMNDKLQEVYPCYFERYRTDGIEFNIYIGQSITPNKPFNKIYLKNVQLWQLNTMALIAKITEKSQKDLPCKIHTTQLIFIHSNTITTSFRIDERRFDVEGGYNIRYEIIKKRIDKALIKGTGERLTQPGKIAIVYFQRKDIEDYLAHISYLQHMKVLDLKTEELELEDMQGISGLKALRIGIAPEATLNAGTPPFLLENPITLPQPIAQSKQK